MRESYANADSECLGSIVAAKAAILAAPIATVVKAFDVCNAAALGPNNPTELFVYALESQAQLNYPYPVGALPAWPVADTCKMLVAAKQSSSAALIQAAAKVTARVIGAPASGCMKALTEGPGGVPGDGPGDDSAWVLSTALPSIMLISLHLM